MCVWQPGKGEKEEREERKEKQNLKIKDFIYKSRNLQNYSPRLLLPKMLQKLLLRLQNKRGLYRPPQGMKIPKNLRNWLSYRTIK